MNPIVEIQFKNRFYAPCCCNTGGETFRWLCITRQVLVIVVPQTAGAGLSSRILLLTPTLEVF